MGLSMGVRGILLLCLLAASPAWAADSLSPQWFQAEFKKASLATGVPYELLSAIAFVESRWTHLVPDPKDTHHARGYGALALRDDSWFGSSLGQAARLLGVSKSKLKRDPSLAILGG